MNIILLSDIFITLIALIFLIFASLTDIKKREVPDWISFSLLAIAFAVKIIISLLTSQTSYIFNALIAFAIFFALTNILYYARFFGGGDAKLLLALAVVFSTTPLFAKTNQIFNEPFLLAFTINIFVLGAIYGLSSSIFLALKNKKEFGCELKKINKDKKTKIMKIASIILSALFLALVFINSNFAPLFFIFLIAPYIYIFIKSAENSSLIKLVNPSKLTEGDWLVNSVKIGKIEIKPSVHGLTKKEIYLLKKAGKKVVVKYGVPFVPAIFLALIATLIFGDLLFYVIKLILPI